MNPKEVEEIIRRAIISGRVERELREVFGSKVREDVVGRVACMQHDGFCVEEICSFLQLTNESTKAVYDYLSLLSESEHEIVRSWSLRKP